MKSIQPPLPSALRSTVAAQQSALERAVENAIAAAEQLDKARAQIGMGPAEKIFYLSSEAQTLIESAVEQALRERDAAEKQADTFEARKARGEYVTRRGMVFGPDQRPVEKINWTVEAVFKMLDYHFASAAANPRALEDNLYVLRAMVFDNAERGAMESFAATANAALVRLKQVDAALAQHAEREAAAEAAIARHEVLPLKRRGSETEERPL